MLLFSPDGLVLRLLVLLSEFLTGLPPLNVELRLLVDFVAGVLGVFLSILFVFDLDDDKSLVKSIDFFGVSDEETDVVMDDETD